MILFVDNTLIFEEIPTVSKFQLCPITWGAQITPTYPTQINIERTNIIVAFVQIELWSTHQSVSVCPYNVYVCVSMCVCTTTRNVIHPKT